MKYAAILSIKIDVHEIKPNNEIDGKTIQIQDIPQKALIKITGDTQEDVGNQIKKIIEQSTGLFSA